MSSLSVDLVHGPLRIGSVVASTRLGCYLLLDLGDAGEVRVLPVLTRAALALPTAVQLTDVEAPALEVGSRVEVGAGWITAAGMRIEVVRTFRPSRVRRCAVSWRADRAVLGALLETRLGRGSGLTPEGDDEIAGHLLVAAATGAPVPDLEPHLGRTTALSASLVRAAARGYAVPTVVSYVDAVLANDHLTTARLRPMVEAIGHTSGPALLRGIHAAAPPDHTGADLHERTVA